MTLTQTAATSRRFVKIGVLLLTVIILFRTGVVVYEIFYPPSLPSTPTPDATMLFGQLPPLEIAVRKIILPSNFSIQLDLYRASLPASPGIANIYPILKAPYGFLSEDRARELARTFGFDEEPTKLSTTESVWTNPNTTLKVNTQSLNFTYEYNFGANPRIFTNSLFTSIPQTEGYANVLLAQHKVLGGFGDDLSGGTRSTFFLSYISQQLTPVVKFSDATSARVDITRQPVSYIIGASTVTIPFVSPHYMGSLTHIIMVNKLIEKNIYEQEAVKLSHTHWKFQPELASTYPVISSQSAWEMLQGTPQNYIVYVGNSKLGPEDSVGGTPEIQTIIAHDAYLAYLDPQKEAEFIQPVWVFTGDALLVSGGTLNWAAYVPAIESEFLSR